MIGTNDFLHPSQLEGYQSSFMGSSFTTDEFELVQQMHQPTGTFYDPQAGTVTVRCKVTGVQKVYELSSGNSWPIEFSEDLHCGFFGRNG